MAVGDSVIGVGVASTALTFQPASGVTIILTGAQCGSTAGWVNFIDSSGTLTTYVANYGGNSGRVQIKMIINNTTYLYIYNPTAGEKVSYCGIQTQ
tara:strand:+ start:156 stop:443 length:288 start_codon:yes stop_codon:yes gene_type:complete